MKVYSKSVWKQISIWIFFIPFGLFLIYMKNNIYPSYRNELIWWATIVFYILIFLWQAIYFNYIILYGSLIVLKNKIYFFWSRTFMYNDIERIIVKNDISQPTVYFRIVSGGKKSCKYLMYCVNGKDLEAIIDDMLSNNVNVEVSDSVIKSYFKKKS